MSNKIKKRSSSVPFVLSRWFSKISSATPSSLLITVVGILYAIFLFGGGLYTLIERPLPSAYVNGNFYFLYPSINSQFISDTVIAIILYGLGFVGLFAIYQSSKNAYNPRQAYMMLVIGVALFLLAYVFLEGAIAFKTSGGA